jgi:hypothetical protein
MDNESWRAIMERRDLQDFYRRQWLDKREECQRIRQKDKTSRDCRFVNCIHNSPEKRFCGIERGEGN